MTSSISGRDWNKAWKNSKTLQFTNSTLIMLNKELTLSFMDIGLMLNSRESLTLATGNIKAQRSFGELGKDSKEG